MLRSPACSGINRIKMYKPAIITAKGIKSKKDCIKHKSTRFIYSISHIKHLRFFLYYYPLNLSDKLSGSFEAQSDSKAFRYFPDTRNDSKKDPETSAC